MAFPARIFACIAAFLGLTGIILAAMGSHLVDMQALPGASAIWQTASMVHLFQAAALLGFSTWLNIGHSRLLLWACGLMLAGTLLFCGSLYLKVASGGNYAGAAPVGGSTMMLAWLLAGVSFWRGS